MTFLIDGYNLMHAVGFLGTATGPLERARNRFLEWLAGAAGNRALLRVVFDAEQGRGHTPEKTIHGIRVRFSYRRTADDEIEDLLIRERRPEQVSVVSNDTRLQDSGRRRGSRVYTCEEFVDWLLHPPTESAASPPSIEKPEQPTADEMAAWLAAFNLPRQRPNS
jgi:predicted RNA-binding protein with PIN domain